MATCPKCHSYISLKQIIFKSPYCENCDIKLGFQVKEYRKVTRPGLFIAILLIFNIRFTLEPTSRAFYNMLIMGVWFYFFYTYLQYLKQAKLKIRK